jgi:acyl-homoserine lactone acylase PvdQ
MARRAATAVVALALALALGPAPAGAGERAYSILAPGEYGGMPAEAHSRDQLRRYDALAPLGLRVRAGDLPRFFVPETLRPAGRGRVERTGRRGLRILRDRFGLPHVYGRRRADVMWGAGWVAGEDRSLLLEQARGVARAALADVPRLDALSLITSGRSFTPSRRAEALVTREARLLVRTYGAKGRQMLRDFDAYAAGVSAEWRHAGVRAPPWTRNDVIAVGALIGAIFGTGGGAEARNAAFLAELEHRLGARGGARVFRDLAAADDPEAPVTAARRFPYGRVVTGTTAGSPPIDRGSLQLSPNPVAAAAAVPTTAAASNALLVGARRSASGRPLAVMGPQLGYFYPAIVYQEDLHGPGIHAQGSAVPGAGAYILIGRARRYAGA